MPDKFFPQLIMLNSHRKSFVASLPGFETLAEVRSDTKVYQRALIRHSGVEGKAVADVLASCSATEGGCCNSACPVCMRKARLWHVRQGELLLKDYTEDELFQVTYVPTDVMVMPQDLAAYDIGKFRAGMHRRLRDAHTGLLMFGGVDFSYNESMDKEWASYWQPHVNFIAAGKNKEETTQLLHAIPHSDPAGDLYKKPLMVKPVTDLRPALSYTFKSKFFRRVTLPKVRKVKTTVLDHNLKGPQLSHLLTKIGQVGYDERAILCQARRQGNYIVKINGGINVGSKQ